MVAVEDFFQDNFTGTVFLYKHLTLNSLGLHNAGRLKSTFSGTMGYRGAFTLSRLILLFSRSNRLFGNNGVRHVRYYSSLHYHCRSIYVIFILAGNKIRRG